MYIWADMSLGAEVDLLLLQKKDFPTMIFKYEVFQCNISFQCTYA